MGDHDQWRLGKLPLNLPPAQMPELLDEIGLSVLAITTQHVQATIEPEPLTRDPFDRLLLAVCQAEDLRLLTLDRALRHHRLALNR